MTTNFEYAGRKPKLVLKLFKRKCEKKRAHPINRTFFSLKTYTQHDGYIKNLVLVGMFFFVDLINCGNHNH